MNTLLLNPSSWDLMVDSAGNIALASDPYAIAQNVASAVRTFLGECYYNTTLGLPYFGEILGQSPPLILVKQQIVETALTVAGVASAKCFITSFANRTITGQIQFTDTSGANRSVSF